MLAAMQPSLAQYPLAFGQWLKGLVYAADRSYEIAIIGDPDDAGTRRLIQACSAEYRPNQVLAVGLGGSDAVPMLKGHTQSAGRATAYVCVTTNKSACLAPVTDPEELHKLIREK
jgi:uncharacterized protein YyaL (SSP411 family)